MFKIYTNQQSFYVKNKCERLNEGLNLFHFGMSFQHLNPYGRKEEGSSYGSS